MSFLTVDNMRVVIDAIAADVGDASPFPVRRLVYDVMRDISGDPVYAGSTLPQLNVAAVAAAVSVLRQMISTAQADPGSGARLSPDQPPAPDGGEAQQSGRAGAGAPPGDAPEPRTVLHNLTLDGADRQPSDGPLRSRFKTPFAVISGTVSVRVDSVILPVRVRNRRPDEVNQVNQDIAIALPNFGYVWLQFDELSGPYTHNLETHARSSFCKLIVKSAYSPGVGRGHMLLEPAHPEAVQLPSPIATLSSLTTTLRGPDGGLLDAGDNSHRLSGVLDPDVPGEWTFRMEPGWADDAFTLGDVVRVRNAATGRAGLDAFLNRREGHVVRTLVFEADVFTAFNVLGPRLPDGAGGFVDDDAAIAQRGEVEAAGEGFGADCTVTNLSLQASVSVTVTSRAQIL